MSDNEPDMSLVTRESDYEIERLRTSQVHLVMLAEVEMALERQQELHLEDEALRSALGAVRAAIHDVLDQPGVAKWLINLCKSLSVITLGRMTPYARGRPPWAAAAPTHHQLS
jgi:hypothetical protein